MSGSAYIFPAALLALPVQLQHRLPPQLQAIDIQFALVLHALLALAASAFTLHPSYLLPLSLFGLAATHHSLTSLLPHFVAFWVLSIPLDLVWLLNKGSDARLIVVSAVGASMILKVPSAVSAAQMASSEGYLPQQDSRRDEAGFGVFAGVGASLPGGLWSGAGGEARDGQYRRLDTPRTWLIK